MPKTPSECRLFSLALVASLASCTGQTQSSTALLPPLSRSFAASSATAPLAKLPSPIRHVVIIFQENRTPDYLFQGIPGADIATTAKDWYGHTVPLRPISLAAGYDLGHAHDSFVKDFNNGNMDGFDYGLPYKTHLRPFGYAPSSEAQPYHDMATQYVLADHMFQSNQGPSFPAHLYIISGTAGDASIQPDLVANNPYDSMTHQGGKGGCDSRPSVVVATIDPNTGNPGPKPYPCFDRRVLSDFLDAKGISWRFYQNSPGAGLWHSYDAIRHVRYGSDYSNVVMKSATVLSDIQTGHLARVSWVMPGDPWSDHAGKYSTTQGPAWVAAIVNSLGQSQYWKDTAIFVTWDDWGGWYDHVKPPIDNYYELGFRVPLLVISPYARQGYVSKMRHEFGSILAFTEETYGIPKGSLQTSDVRSDDLMDAFDFTQKPRVFQPIKAPPFRLKSYAGPSLEDP
jgi:phospholipase C